MRWSTLLSLLGGCSDKYSCFPVFLGRNILETLTYSYCLLPRQPSVYKRNHSKLGSCGERGLRVIICCLQAQHSGRMICSGPGSAVCSISKSVVVTCSVAYSFTKAAPQKGLPYMNQD